MECVRRLAVRRPVSEEQSMDGLQSLLLVDEAGGILKEDEQEVEPSSWNGHCKSNLNNFQCHCCCG